MKMNGQYLIKYSAGTFAEITELIKTNWMEVYSDCRIVKISVSPTCGGGLGYHALVVFEEVSDDGKSD